MNPKIVYKFLPATAVKLNVMSSPDRSSGLTVKRRLLSRDNIHLGIPAETSNDAEAPVPLSTS